MVDYEGAIHYILEKLENDLNPHLYYHGLHHTKDVLQVVEKIAMQEGVSKDDVLLLKVAAAYHDCGFLLFYKNHEEAGCGIAHEVLPKFGFSQKQMNLIFGMIKSTRVPQSPQTKLEKILCDADLDYLGRDDFARISSSLFEEYKYWNIVEDDATWVQLQLNFLQKHEYWTEFSRKNRAQQKRKRFEELKAL